MRALVEAHSQTRAVVVAPLISGERGNPVQFDRTIFPELMHLKGDAGARQILARFPPCFVPWDDASLLLDIDTPAEYRQFVEGL